MLFLFGSLGSAPALLAAVRSNGVPFARGRLTGRRGWWDGGGRSKGSSPSHRRCRSRRRGCRGRGRRPWRRWRRGRLVEVALGAERFGSGT